jgi:two-component system OmpR family response regulator
MRILVVEDDEPMAAALKRGLEEERHTVTTASDGTTGLALAETYDFDVVVLDVMLPCLTGLDVARRLRERGRSVAILMLTARDSTRDIVAGLDAGADDYLNKPFAFDELVARIRSLGRRRHTSHEAVLAVAGLVLDPATRKVARDGCPLQLTATEFRLLEALMRAAGRVLTRDALIESVWGVDREIEVNTLEVFIRLLRRKVDEPFATKLVRTIHAVGYSLRQEA